MTASILSQFFPPDILKCGRRRCGSGLELPVDLKRYLPDMRTSGMYWVAAGFGILSVLNALTLVPGPENVLSSVNGNPLAPVLAVIVFDTPWTIAGLIGLVVLFSPVLFGAPVGARRTVSLFFVAASFVVGITAGALWDAYYDELGVVGAGASGIAIAGQGVVFGLAILGLVRLWRQDTRGLGRMSRYWWQSFAVIYATLILTTIWFVVLLQPIFTPTLLYNWRVHEIAFLMSVSVTLLFGLVARSALGLDGKVRVDEMLLNFHFDDLAGRFARHLPKLKVGFSDLPPGTRSEFRPETGEVLLPGTLRGTEYAAHHKEVDDALLHGMVHAELYYSGRPWEHGHPETRKEFDALAAEVGAAPDS